MDRRLRDVKKELNGLVTDQIISDFEFEFTRKHMNVRFLHQGRWREIPCSTTSHHLQPAYVRQGIRRVIRG